MTPKTLLRLLSPLVPPPNFAIASRVLQVKCNDKRNVGEPGVSVVSRGRRRAALIACVGASIATVSAQLPAQASRSVLGATQELLYGIVTGPLAAQERTLAMIYAFDPKSDFWVSVSDPSLDFWRPLVKIDIIYDVLSFMDPSLSFLAPAGPCSVGTYGEITREGVEMLAEKLGLRDNPTETFYDLGSGAGRVVLHMCVGGYVRGECHGIEYFQARNDAAEALKTEVVRAAENDEVGSKLASKIMSMVSFEQGNVKEKDFSDATLIWTDNLCFPEEVNRAIGKKIMAYPKVQTVAAVKFIPGLEEAGFELTKISIPQTFAEVETLLYRRRQE